MSDSNYVTELNRELLGFIRQSASVYHTVETVSGYLERAGFQELKEQQEWQLRKTGKYYVKRNNSSIIAFSLGALVKPVYFKIAASHSDSPTFAIKEIPELAGPGSYIRLNTEAYGGMIDYTWLDRPLGVAGRVMVRRDRDRLENCLVYPDEDLLLIPSQCIHFNRDVNKGMAFDRKTDLCPMFSAGKQVPGGFRNMIAGLAGADPEDLLGWNLFLVNRQEGKIWGTEEEFISSPRLDDLQCAFTSLKGFLNAVSGDTGNDSVSEAQELHSGINVYACFDNEEVGSNTKQGAMSTFLADVLKRICKGTGGTDETYMRAVAGSFLVSFDNAHALHPNHPEKSDACNTPLLNQGIVIKENASQKYVTDAFSRGIFQSICGKAEVPCQTFANRSDIAGGSTLGNLSNTQVSMHGVDVGLPQLAMHSAYETAGAQDTLYAVKALETFFRSDICIDGADSVTIR